jgi:hypothetical protein
MELRHFIHKHPLIFNEEVLSKDCGGLLCDGCGNQVLGPNYSCKQCSWFVLHELCAQLPHELEHPSHPKYPLRLIHTYSWKREIKWDLEHPLHPKYPPRLIHAYSWKKEIEWDLENHLYPKYPPRLINSQLREIKCDGCNTEVLWGFIYHCSDCNFSLESKCASLPLTIQSEIHAHPLTLVRRSLSFTCDACGKHGKGMVYLCAICPFLVHLQCSSYPLLPKQIRHGHPPKLPNSLQDTFPIESTSMLSCEDPGLDESIDSLTYVVKKSKMGDDNIEIAVEIKHFSHEHDMNLIDEELEKQEKCDGCLWPIEPPFYTCTQCRFFLHKSCVELPRKKSHPLHRHPLTLLPEPPYVPSFSCYACGRDCNGFVYRCDKCNFDLDVQCSLISDTFRHECHFHQLFISCASYSGKCNSCDSKGQMLRCGCEFNLDFKCATLPPTVRYEPYSNSNEETFVLCFEFEDDYHDEYNCDICGKERVRNHWFYYSPYGGDLAAHPACILGKYPNIKFGRTYTFDMHEHPLTFVDKSEEPHPPCDKCGDSCHGMTFECLKCNFSLHHLCLIK